MAHRIIRIGSKPRTLVDLDGPQLSWPDIDVGFDGAGNRVEGAGKLYAAQNDQLGRVRAVALAFDTDWDMVRIRPTGSSEALVLGPRQLLSLSDFNVKRFSVEPHVAAPSTRLYAAQGLRGSQDQAPTVAPAGNWVIERATGFFKPLDGRAYPAFYTWVFNSMWQQPGVHHDYAPGEVIGGGLAAGNNNNVDQRPADVSPDGLWNFADYMEAGLIKYDDGGSAKGVAYISLNVTDSRGQPGSNGAATVIKYNAAFVDVSPLFYGRLSLELWTDDDCPPAGYVPRLAPVRFISFDQIGLAAGGAPPNRPIVTVPAINVERAQYLAHNIGAGNVFAQLIQPRAEDWIDDVKGVADVDPATGLTYTTIANGADGAAFLDEPAGPYIKLVLGADGGGATVANRSVLSLVRRAA